ncbi:ATP-binding protein [Halomonas sp. EGI 63088]|uniref:ATP-binding protein n=1 Tax=Halomonas flagellata TaxID=2920385 RepID=A0ABS9RQ10_9GAMM|nr:ATP-binding protein [Halomonas flagellata]MCH4561928.1 ATP-binding protein [Halomonas flagellata]
MSFPEHTSATDPATVEPAAKDWQQANDDWLSASVAHLRLRLTALAAEHTRPAEAPRGGNRWTALLGGGDTKVSPPVQSPSKAELNAALRKREEAEQATDPPPALHLLGDRFGLTPFEREVLLLCAAVELDTRVAGLCAAAQGDATRVYPTFALALALFDEPAWDVMSPIRPLRYWRLLEINQPGNQPLTGSALRADERVVNFLKGLSYLDDRLSPFLVPFEADFDGNLPPSQEAAAAQVARHLSQTAEGTTPLVQLVGTDPISQEMVAQQAARALNLTLYKLPATMLPRQATELETLARLWHRESLLMPIALYLDAREMGTGDEAPEPTLARFLARSGGVFLIGTREGRGDLGPMVQAVPVAKPTAVEQVNVWSAALSSAPRETVAQLSGQFDLNAPAIRRIARVVGNGGATGGALWQACIETSALRLDRLAERIRPVATWNDIVLPETEETLLRQLAAQVARRAQVYDEWGFRARMNRGLGISALFAGDSGTGKTMAAEVIANALDLRLYRIDLSAVVSKYIGETEKNLRQLFDAAEGGGAILFFDEADALFGKRSEVRDSHDRYANIETSYLLQRVESFRGLAILSTNMRGALDTAFLRRLRFVINFPYPGPEQRRTIWMRAWPQGVPREGLDYDRLAKLNLSGGNIATVALNATFMAAEEGGPVTMPRVLAAARAEYEKLERPIHEADFRWREPERLKEANT